MFSVFVNPYNVVSVNDKILGKCGNLSVELTVSLQYSSWVNFNAFIQQIFLELPLWFRHGARCRK